jgi:hypothetical protein
MFRVFKYLCLRFFAAIFCLSFFSCAAPSADIVPKLDSLRRQAVQRDYPLSQTQATNFASASLSWASRREPKEQRDTSVQPPTHILYSDYDSMSAIPMSVGDSFFMLPMGRNRIAVWVEYVSADSSRVLFAATGAAMRKNAAEILHEYFIEARGLSERREPLPPSKPRHLPWIE